MLVKRYNVPPFKGASTGMQRQADDVTRIDEARCTAHANARNLKRQLEQCCNDAERLPGFRGDSIRSALARSAFVMICTGLKHYILLSEIRKYLRNVYYTIVYQIL